MRNLNNQGLYENLFYFYIFRYLGKCVLLPTWEFVVFLPIWILIWLTHDCNPEQTISPSNRPLGEHARKHHSLLNAQCFGEFTPHQLGLSRPRKIVPEEHHLYSTLQAQTSPDIQTYRDAPFLARQTPREHQIAAWVSVAQPSAHTFPTIAEVAPTSSS